MAHPLNAQGGERPEALCEFGYEGRSGWRDALAGFIHLPKRNTGQNFKSRRSRKRKTAVRAFDPSPSFDKGRGLDAERSQCVEPGAGRHNVGDRIRGPHLVESDVLGRDAVDFPLGDGNALENGQGPSFDLRLQTRSLDEPANFAVRATMGVVAVGMVVIAVIAVIVPVGIDSPVPVIVRMDVE